VKFPKASRTKEIVITDPCVILLCRSRSKAAINCLGNTLLRIVHNERPALGREFTRLNCARRRHDDEGDTDVLPLLLHRSESQLERVESIPERWQNNKYLRISRHVTSFSIATIR